MAKKIDLSHFDKVKKAYDLSGFDAAHPAPTEEPGILESLLRGGAQGATLGFADELTGAGQAGLEALTGKSPEESLMEKYQRARDESRKNYEAAETAHPTASFVGNIAGGLAPGLLTGGIGEGATIASAAASGAGLGALGGLGTSKADLTKGETTEAGKDVLAGGALGAGLGAATQYVGAGLKNVYDKALKPFGQKQVQDFLDISSVDKAIHSYKIGRGEGKSVMGSKNFQKFGEEVNAIRDDIEGGLKSILGQLKSEKNEVLSNTEKSAQVDELYSTSINKLNALREKFGYDDTLMGDLDQIQGKLDSFFKGKKKILNLGEVTTTSEEPVIPESLKQDLEKLNVKNKLARDMTQNSLDNQNRTFDRIVAETVGEPTPGNEYTEAILSGRKATGTRSFSPTLKDADGNLVAPPKLEPKADALETMKRELDQRFIDAGSPYETRPIDYEGKQYLAIVDKVTGKPANTKLYKVSDTGKMAITEKNVPVEVMMGGKVNNGQAGVEDIENFRTRFGQLGKEGKEELATGEGKKVVSDILGQLKTTVNTAAPEVVGKNLGMSTLLSAEESLPNIIKLLSPEDMSLAAIQAQGEVGKFTKLLTGKGLDLSGMPSNLKSALPQDLQERLAKEGVKEVPENILNSLDPGIKDQIVNYQNSLKEVSSRLDQKFGPMIKQLADKAKESSIRRQVAAPGLTGGITGLVAGTARGAAYIGANVAGRTVRTAAQIGKGVQNIIIDSTPESIVQLASKAKTSFGKMGESLGQVLEQVANTDGARRRALMFGVMQNPDYRKILQDMTGESTLPEQK